MTFSIILITRLLQALHLLESNVISVSVFLHSSPPDPRLPPPAGSKAGQTHFDGLCSFSKAVSFCQTKLNVDLRVSSHTRLKLMAFNLLHICHKAWNSWSSLDNSECLETIYYNNGVVHEWVLKQLKRVGILAFLGFASLEVDRYFNVFVVVEKR